MADSEADGGAGGGVPDRRHHPDRRGDAAIEHVRQFAETLPVPFTATNRHGVSVVANSAYVELIGLTADAVASRAMGDAVHPDDVERGRQVVAAAADGRVAEIEVRLRHAKGHYLRAVWRLRRDPTTGLVFAVVLDVSGERAVTEKLHHESRHDALTGAANRLLVMARLNEWIRTAAREGHEVGVALVDMDRFKRVNDQHGHRIGDLLLIETTKRLREIAPAGALIGRMGGDEFIVALPLLAQEDMGSLAQRLMAVQGDAELRGQVVQLRASIGVSCGTVDPEQLLHQADVAAYVAKQAGGGGWATYDERVRLADEATLRRDAHVIEACMDGTVDVAFQPIHGVADGRLHGVELTPVLRGPGGWTLTGPEVTEAVMRLGLDDVVPAIRRMAVQHLAGSTGDVALHLDLIPRDFSEDDRLDRLLDTVELHGLDTDRLVLEVREDILLQDLDGAIVQLRRARDRGCRVALDRFGTGSTSLRQLALLPLDLLKIDGSFLAEAHRTLNARTIIDGLVAIAPALGLTVAMDGVDADEDVILVEKLGGTLAQGDRIGPLLSGEDLRALPALRQGA